MTNADNVARESAAICFAKAHVNEREIACLKCSMEGLLAFGKAERERMREEAEHAAESVGAVCHFKLGERRDCVSSLIRNLPK